MALKERLIETDILILGGGIAGLYAAIRAKSTPLDVVLVDKAFPGRSGSSLFASGAICGYQPDDNAIDYLIDDLKTCFFLDDQVQARKVIEGIYACRKEMESWGVDWVRDDKGNIIRKKGIGMTSSYNIHFNGGRRLMNIIRGEAIRRGTLTMDRIMITDLLQANGEIIGAAGFHIRTGDFYCINAKSTIIATGVFDAKGGQPQWNLTGDGVAAALRVGAELRNMEQYDWTMAPAKYFDRSSGCHVLLGHGAHLVNRFGGRFIHKYLDRFGCSAELGDRTPRNVFVYSIAQETATGNGPIFIDCRHLPDHEIESIKNSIPFLYASWVKAKLNIKEDLIEYTVLPHGTTATGGIKIDENAETTISGLYCAGDAADRMWAGINGLTGAIVSGCWAAESAVKRALEILNQNIDIDQVMDIKKRLFQPLQGGSLKTSEAISKVQQILYQDIGIMRTAERLEHAISNVRAFRNEALPKLYAQDFHDLAKVHEITNAADLIETIAMCSLFRKETRYFNIREDFPGRDDKNWLKWVVLTKDGEEVKLKVEDIPETFISIKELDLKA
jgi:succinate dehydrogenase/fumarate reductase flavoprotein subunit